MSRRVFLRNYSYENEFHLHVNFHANQTHFHLNGFARGLVLKMRQRATRKWPINSRALLSYYIYFITRVARNKATQSSALDWLMYEIHSTSVFSPTCSNSYILKHKNAAELFSPLCTFAGIFPFALSPARKVFASLFCRILAYVKLFILLFFCCLETVST